MLCRSSPHRQTAGGVTLEPRQASLMEVPIMSSAQLPLANGNKQLNAHWQADQLCQRADLMRCHGRLPEAIQSYEQAVSIKQHIPGSEYEILRQLALTTMLT